jgi:Mg2+ and Co2+ transporter CorA
VVAISRLDIANIDSVKHFKRDIRQLQEIFLRFTHRYWFHEVSNREPARDLFRFWTDHLSMDRLFAEVREEVQDMSHYLDSDGLRRQANSVVRLTVVTIFGLVGTLVTGFLGMNLIAAAEEPLWLRALFFLVVLIPLIALILYTIVKSKRLSDFLEALSDERLSNRQKFRHLLKVRDR